MRKLRRIVLPNVFHREQRFLLMLLVMFYSILLTESKCSMLGSNSSSFLLFLCLSVTTSQIFIPKNIILTTSTKRGFFSPPKLIHEYTQKLGKPPEDNEDLQGGIRHSLLCIPAIWQTSPPPTSSFVSNLCQQEIRTEHLAQII